VQTPPANSGGGCQQFIDGSGNNINLFHLASELIPGADIRREMADSRDQSRDCCCNSQQGFLAQKERLNLAASGRHGAL